MSEAQAETAFVRDARPISEHAYLIALAGDFDLHSGPEFERRVLEALGRGASELLIDLSEVSFIDSTTIGILMRTRKRLARGGSCTAIPSIKVPVDTDSCAGRQNLEVR